MANKIAISEGLYHFIKEHASDHHTLQVILFFADHPHAQFNELAIIHALNQDGGRRSLQKALKVLVDKGMIKALIVNNATVYSLPENMRSLASELARFDVHQRWLLQRQTCAESVGEKMYLFGDMAEEAFSDIPALAIAEKQNTAVFHEEKHLFNTKNTFDLQPNRAGLSS